MQSSKEDGNYGELCNSCHLSKCKVLFVWVFTLMWEDLFSQLLKLSAKLLILLTRAICRKFKSQAKLLRFALFFQISCLTPNLLFI